MTKLIQDRVYHPYALYLLSAICRRAGHQTGIVDAISYRHVAKKIREFRPDVLAISTISSRWSFFRELAQRLKQEFSLPIIIGGTHPTFRPAIVREPFLDAACVLEGDEAIVELLAALESGQDYSQIRNLAVKDPSQAEGYRVNPLRPLLQDFDSLPMPHFELTDQYAHCREMPVRIMVLSRGCLFQCTSCQHSGFRRIVPEDEEYYRRYSVERAIAELRYVKEHYPTQFFAIFDDVFVTKDEWIYQFAEQYKKQIDLPFSCHMVNGIVDPNVVKALKEAGLHWVGISLESGSERILHEVLDRNYTIDEFIHSIDVLNSLGVRSYVGNMLALPTSTLETDLATLEVNRRAKVGFADSSLYIPLPGSVLGERARAEHLFDVARFDRSFHSTDPSLRKQEICDVPHRKVVRRLQCLFEIAAENDFVYRHIRLLIKLPLFPLYLFIWKVHNALKKKNFMFSPVQMSFKLKLMMAYNTLIY